MSFRKRNEICLGDLATAVKRLPTQDKTHLAKIAGCLGFGLEAVQTPEPKQKGFRGKEPQPDQQEFQETTPTKPTDSPVTRKTRPRVTLPKPPAPVEGYVSHIEDLPREEPSLPSRIEQAEPLRLDIEPSNQVTREPIFVKRTERAILSAAVAVQTETGRVDMVSVIERLIRQKLVDQLPRHALPTLKYGVQLMLDHSESMHPYMQDQQALEERLMKISGRSRFWAHHFTGSPLSPPRFVKKRKPLKLVNNVPVLLVTDFGIGAPLLSRDRAEPDEWREFAKQAAQKNCPVVAFIPHKPTFWPKLAKTNFLCIHWDRTTTAGDLRKIIGIGHSLQGTNL